MSSLRGLKPTTGFTVLLGTGFAAVCFGYSESDARQGLASRAAKTRKQVLLAALSKRLQQQSQQRRFDLPTESPVDELLPTHRAAAIASSSSTVASPDLLTEYGSFYVVTGPDIHLTTIARDRVRRILQLQRSTNMSTAPSARHPSPAHLVVPYDCVIGTGHLSSLVEKQLLSRQAPPEIHDESEQLHRPTTLRTSSEAVIDEDLKDEEILSSLERLLLRATRWIMDPEQLDNVALWALEGALTPASPGAASEETLPTSAYRSTSSPWATVGAKRSAVDDKGNEVAATGRGEEGARVLAIPEERSDSQAAEMGSVCGGANSFVLEIVTRAYRDQESFEKRSYEDGERMESPAIGGEIFRWGWHLANRGLGNVIVSSSNPWILAELRQALNTESEELVSGSVEEGGDSGSFASFKGVSIDAGLSSEVILVRVTLPSAAEREEAVTAVAEELEVDHRLSARDVSTLADLTGGRRGPLLDVLTRLQASPSSAKVDGICRAAVDDQALALARCWGLLSPVENTERSSGELKGQDNKRKGQEQLRQWEDDRVALWEALHVLSAPVVSLGTAAPASMRPPEGNMPPSELLRACELDPATLLRLTRQGWLEVSPAGSTSGSAVVLRDPEAIPDSSTGSLTQCSGELQTGTRSSQARSPPPEVRAFVEKVPVESLGRLLHRSFVGAAPLHLAAFRRLVDSVTPPSKTQGIGDGLNGLVVGRDREGDGQAGGGHYAGDWRSGQLERAGFLIEASVLRRQAEREDERLTEDGEKLSYYWSELASVRQDLERQGRGDASEGEWAEVQLELIRQERAVVAEAQEMRTRRSRVETTRDKIQGLGRRARSVPPSLLPRQEDAALPSVDLATSSGVRGEQWRVSLPEEGVLRDAEGGVRLMPLKELSQQSSTSVEGDGNMDRGQPVGETARDKSVWTWGYGQRLWRWLSGG